MTSYFRISISSPSSSYGLRGEAVESFDIAADSMASAWAYADRVAEKRGQSIVTDVHETTKADIEADVLADYDRMTSTRHLRMGSLRSWHGGVALRILCSRGESDRRNAVARLVRRGVLVKDRCMYSNRTEVYRAEDVPAEVAARL